MNIPKSYLYNRSSVNVELWGLKEWCNDKKLPWDLFAINPIHGADLDFLHVAQISSSDLENWPESIALKTLSDASRTNPFSPGPFYDLCSALVGVSGVGVLSSQVVVIMHFDLRQKKDGGCPLGLLTDISLNIPRFVFVGLSLMDDGHIIKHGHVRGSISHLNRLLSRHMLTHSRWKYFNIYFLFYETFLFLTASSIYRTIKNPYMKIDKVRWKLQSLYSISHSYY